MADGVSFEQTLIECSYVPGVTVEKTSKNQSKISLVSYVVGEARIIC